MPSLKGLYTIITNHLAFGSWDTRRFVELACALATKFNRVNPVRVLST